MDSNLKTVFVQRSTMTAPDGTANSQIWDATTTATYIEDGAIVVTNELGLVLNASDTADTIVIRARQDGSVYKSVSIPVADVTNYKVSTYRPALEQSTFVGYNGTDSTFTSTLTSTGTYQVSIWRNDDPFYMGVDRPKTASYVQGSNSQLALGLSSTGVSQAEIVMALQDIIYKSFVKTITGYSHVDIPIKIEVISDCGAGSKTALNTTIAVTNESTYFVLGGAADASMVAGVILSIAGKLYVVKDYDSTAHTGNLMCPYQGTTATVYSGTSATTCFTYVGTVANYNTAKFGLQITGLSKIFATNLWLYRKTRFDVQTNTNVTGQVRTYAVGNIGIDKKGLTTTTTTYVKAGTIIPDFGAFEGVGTYERVSEIEHENLGFHGVEKQYRESIATEKLHRQLVSDLNGSSCVYSILNMEIRKQYKDNPINVINDSNNVIIAIPVTYTDNGSSAVSLAETKATATGYGYVTVLDAILPSTLADQATAVTTY